MKKKDGPLRVCVDYTRLNSFTRPLYCLLPKIDELSAIIPGGTCFFTNIDLWEAYFSLLIAIKSRKYTAVILIIKLLSHHVASLGWKMPYALPKYDGKPTKECDKSTSVNLVRLAFFAV